MKPSPNLLLLPAFVGLALSKLESRGWTKLQCRHVNELGKTKLCLPMCNPCSSPNVAMCDDLATGCNENELFGLASGITVIKTGGQCYPNSPNSYFYNKQYDYRCCACPTGYKPYTYDHNADPNCDPMASCVGCTEPDETLVIPPNDYPKCVKKTPPPPKNTCTGLITYANATYLKGKQVVISPSFLPDIKHLISCVASTAIPKGLVDKKKAALSIDSAARCGESVGLTPAKGISDHQIGRAVDANLILPDGTACSRDGCMGLAYCAFHPTKQSCLAIVKKHKPTKSARNTWINDFLTCAGSSGMQVGAGFAEGDWNHFERDVKDIKKAYEEFQPHLKNFCLKKCGVDGPKKINPSQFACNCPGYH